MERIKYIPGDLVYVPKFCNNYTIVSSGKYYYEARDENDVVIERTDIVPITSEILDNNKWKRLNDTHGGEQDLMVCITSLNLIKIILLYGNFVVVSIALKRLDMSISFNIFYLV